MLGRLIGEGLRMNDEGAYKSWLEQNAQTESDATFAHMPFDIEQNLSAGLPYRDLEEAFKADKFLFAPA
jgi:hypothetical protein